MKCRIVILNGADLFTDRDVGGEFLADFTDESLTGRFACLDFSSREFPLPLKISIPSGCGENALLFGHIAADDGSYDFDGLHIIMLLGPAGWDIA